MIDSNDRSSTATPSSPTCSDSGTASMTPQRIARPTSMPTPREQPIGGKVPPPLGPFKQQQESTFEIPQSPLDIPLLTPAIPQFTPACVRQFFFDPTVLSSSQLSPLSPITPLTPMYTWDTHESRTRHASQSSTLSGFSVKSQSYDPYSGRYRQAPQAFDPALHQQELAQQYYNSSRPPSQAPQPAFCIPGRGMPPMLPVQAMIVPPQQSAPSIKQTWYRTFDELFGQFREPWMLKQIDSDEEEPSDPGWGTEEYWAKVRFICETPSCPNQWTSMRGVIRFWYTTALRPYQSNLLIRQLIFRSFGQKCAKCTNAKFQLPLWYEREVKKVLVRIHEHIARHIYHMNPYANVFYGMRNIAARPHLAIESQKGAPTAEHKSELCQGCANNTCAYSPAFRARARSFKQSPQLAQIPEHTERQPTPDMSQLAIATAD